MAGQSTAGVLPDTAEAPSAPWPSAPVAWGWVAVCVLAYICSYIDRQILSLMVDEIKGDLGISDSQFGLLHGLSFALLYCTAGLPLGSLVDRYSRRTIIFAGITFWTVMTMACGLARQYVPLFIARVGVGVGEATLSPAAYSLLADCFDKKRLGRAISVYYAGGGVGAGIAFLAGGSLITAISAWPVSLPFVGDLRTWQAVFFIVALPGIPIALLLLLLREPPRRGRVAAVQPTWGDVLAYLVARWRVMLPFFVGIACVAGVSLGTLSWVPAVMMRVHGVTPGIAGFELGIVMLLSIPLGMIGGAILAERFDARGGRDSALLVSALASLAIVAATAATIAVDGRAAYLAAIFATMTFVSIPFGICAAALQTMVPNEMRGRASALLLLCQNGLGMVLGPLLPGLINDRMFGGDPRSIGIALSITLTAFAIVAAVLLALAYRAAGRAEAPASFR